MSHVFDVGYICHLADLAAKPGMEVFPVDIDIVRGCILLLLPFQ